MLRIRENHERRNASRRVAMLAIVALLTAVPLLHAENADFVHVAEAQTSEKKPADEKKQSGNSAPEKAPDAAEGENDATQKPVQSFFAETTVTATGSRRDVFEVATPVTVITEEKIQRKNPENAADLLREEPGVDVAGVGPNQMRPVIRAQRGLRVLFLENGLRLNNARRQTDFGEISGLVDLDSVKTMEVVRGPASVLYGSDAIGGVLNLVSRDPDRNEPFRGFVDLSYANAGDLRRGGASITGSHGRFSFQLGASRRHADDYTAPAGRFGDIRLEDDTEVVDTGVDDQNIWGSLGYSVDDRNEIRFRLTHYDADDTGFGFIPGEKYGVEEEVRIRILYPSQTFDRYTLSYFGNYDRNPLANSASIQIYHQENKRVLVNNIDVNIGPVGPGFPDSGLTIDTRNFTDLTTTGFRADAVKILLQGRHTLTYGLEAYRDRSENTDFSQTVAHIRFPGPPFEITDEQTSDRANAPNATNTSSGVFVQDEMLLLPRLRLTAGLRYHQVETKAKSTPQWDVRGLDFKDHNTVEALTATYQITDYLNALVSYGTAFRAPNIIERLFNGPTPEGSGYQILNPDLSSEESDNWDIGLKYRRSNAFMELVGFRNVVKQGIIQDFLSPAEIAQLPADVQAAIEAVGAQYVVQQVNADRLKYQGLELALGYHAASGVTVGGNYTYIDASRLGATTILPPDDVYSNKAFAYARYEPVGARWWAEYNLRHNGSADANVDPNEPVPPVGATLPSFTVQNVGVGARLWEGGGLTHDLTLWVDNVTNRLYAEFTNASFFRPEPGRTARVSYRLGF